MNLKKVKITNFRGYGVNDRSDDGSFTFDELNQGLVVLNGFNGFGKTSFYEAIEWCLTDSIKRLASLKDLYGIQGIRQSDFLKFVTPSDTKAERDNRVAKVELEFDNGIHIKRETTCNFVSVSESDGYESTLYIKNGNEWLTFQCTSESNSDAEKTGEALLSEIFFGRYESEWKAQLLPAHFLGQETMNNFLRGLKPNDRRSILIRLLDLVSLEDVFNKSKTIKDSTRLSNKIGQLSNKIHEAELRRKSLEALIASKNWGSVEQYLTMLQQEYEHFIKLVDSYSLEDEFQLERIVPDKKIRLNNCAEIFYKLALIQEKYSKKAEEFEKELQEIKMLQSEIERLSFLEKRIELHTKLQQVNYLLETNSDELIKQRNGYEKQLETYKKTQALYQQKQKSLKDFESLCHLSWSQYINSQSATITDDFWDMFSEWLIKLHHFLEKYSEEVSGHDLPRIPNLFLEEIRETYKEEDNKRKQLEFRINEKKSIAEEMSRLNSDYHAVLNEVRTYLTSQDNVKECPVCLSSQFSAEKYQEIISDPESPIGDQLLEIIQFTMSSGDRQLQEINSEITQLEQDLASINNYLKQNVFNVVLDCLTTIKRDFPKLFDHVSSTLDDKLLVIQRQMKELTDDFQNVLSQIGKIRNIYSQLVGSDNAEVNVDQKKVQNMYSRLENEIRQWEIEAVERKIYGFPPAIDEVKQDRLELQGMVHDYYPDNTKLLKSKLEEVIQQIHQVEQVSNCLHRLLKYRLTESEFDLLEGYDAVTQGIEEARGQLNLLIKYKEDVEKIYSIVNSTQQYFIAEKLENNRLVNWIFQMIYPHPYYNEVRMDGDRRGISIKNAAGNVILDHIFSLAQLNILALSIFLGLGLTQKFSRWDQLFLDDPIQSMDDIKILAFIDVLRAITDSQKRSRKLVISTHDDNFAKLLAIKYRNKPFTQYNFVGYGPQGPLFHRV